MSKENNYNYLSPSEKISAIAQACVNFPVQRYDKNINQLFVETKLNGCLSLIKFVLTGSGIVTPDFIGPDGIQRPMNHVNEFFDHFGINIPFGQQKEGDLVFFSWDGIRPQHIGIVINTDTYIHAHTSDGWVKKNRIATHLIKTDKSDTVYITNPIGFKRPTISNKDDRWFQKPIT